MAFNKNYLSAQSQPWAREVQKRVSNLETAFRSAEVNNTTRDDQLASSFRRLDANFLDTQQAAADALSAINRILGLGSPGGDDINGANIVAGTVTADEISASYVYAGTINADQITAGSISADRISGGTIDASDISGVNITGVNISGSTLSTSPSSGRNVDISGSSAFFRYNGSYVGEVTASSTGQLLVSGNGGLYLNGGTSGSTFFGSGGLSIGDSATLSVAGRISSTGTYNAVTTQSTNMYIATNGFLSRTTNTSSREAKQNIVAFDFDSEAFLEVSPVTFDYKEGIITDQNADSTNQLGFIAEDFEDAGLGEHLVLPANDVDEYKSLRYDKLYMFLHKSVQELNNRVKELENDATN